MKPFEIYLRFGGQTGGKICFSPHVPYPLHLSRHSTKGLKLKYQLRDDTGVKFTLAGADARGNDVALGDVTVTATVSDPKILTASYASGTLTVEPVGPLGEAQVALTATLADGTTVSGSLDVTIVGGTPININLENAETFSLTPPTPPTS